MDEIVNEANVLISEGSYEAALARYQKATEVAPGDERGYCGAASACMLMEKYEGVVKWMERLILVHPDTAYAHAFMGAAMDNLDTDRALACYDRALELDPDDVVTRIERAYAIGEAGRKKEAEKELQKALLSEPTDAAAAKTQEIIKSLARKGKLGKSNHHSLVTVPGMMKVASVMFSDENVFFEHICSRDGISMPRKLGVQLKPDELLERANKLADGDKLAEAIKTIDEAIAVDPDFANAHSAKVMFLARTGRYRDAIECIDRLIELGPDDPASHMAKGMLLERVGRPTEAVACYDRVLEMTPGDMTVRHLKCGLLAATGDAKGLVECYRAAIKAKPDRKDADIHDYMHAEYNEIMRRAEAAGSLESGFTRFMRDIGVNAEPIWGRGGSARRAAGRRVRAGRRR